MIGRTRAAESTLATPPWAAGAGDDESERALAEAARARAAGAWSDVLAHAERAATAAADHGAVTELRAVALTHLGRIDEAEAQFAALLANPGRRHRGECGLGIIALERGDDQAARAWLERATTGGGDAAAWAALGVCLTRLGAAEDAWRAYVEARRRDPAHRAALHGLMTLAGGLERLAELETHLREYLAGIGEDADVRFALAGCLYAAGRNDESRAAVRDVLRQAPTHALARALERELAS